MLDQGDFGPEGTFHLKHKGMTLVAEKITRLESGPPEVFKTTFKDGHGILDGGHTYELITQHRDDPDLPEEQFIKIEVLTGLKDEWIPAISQGLNTSVQVQAMSLDNLKGMFDPIKKYLESKPYFSKIAWQEGENGDVDARDIVGLMTLFNIDDYPNTQGAAQPVIGYSSKAQALQRFEQNQRSYKKIIPILPDILKLHDTILFTALEHWNEGGGRFRRLGFNEVRKRGMFDLPFIGEQLDHRMMVGALYPILAAFRWYVVEDPATKVFVWRGGFDKVVAAWKATSKNLLKVTYDQFNQLGGNAQTLGKSRTHWADLHRVVSMHDLVSRATP